MSQNLVYDFLVLNAPVRRIGNDLDRPAAPASNRLVGSSNLSGRAILIVDRHCIFERRLSTGDYDCHPQPCPRLLPMTSSSQQRFYPSFALNQGGGALSGS